MIVIAELYLNPIIIPNIKMMKVYDAKILNFHRKKKDVKTEIKIVIIQVVKLQGSLERIVSS